MAKIALRAYNREIETLVERGQIEEAIAHSKYILRFFPKHVETYRLLGKAYIESQRYSEAADVLQRILSVLPDDFVSQIGMSIIREDEGNLDAAIFHMERAHEIQPSNVAVQDELRRLYGRRDGVEPPRLRLTRGALVRLYAKGDLHRQAIAEIRAALAEDPNRYDLEVILARMYYLLGQKVEATDVASRLVSKLPYCLEANRVLADILPSTSRAEDAKIYQQRVYALDPYLAYISPNAPTVNLVPDNAVTLDRLEWQPSISGEVQPAWAQDVGITLGEEKETETEPDWLTAPSEPEPAEQKEPPLSQTTLPTPVIEPSEMPQASANQIPDWMQASGWVEAGAATPEGEAIEEEATPGELPDWLKEMAPQPEETVPPLGEESKLDWLDEILPPVTAVKGEEAATLAAEQVLGQEGAGEGVAFQESATQAVEEIHPAAEEALPEWLTFTPSEVEGGTEVLVETAPEAEPASGQPAETPQPETAFVAQDQTPITGLHFEAHETEAILEPAAEAKIEPAITEETQPGQPPVAEIQPPTTQPLEEVASPVAGIETPIPAIPGEMISTPSAQTIEAESPIQLEPAIESMQVLAVEPPVAEGPEEKPPESTAPVAEISKEQQAELQSPVAETASPISPTGEAPSTGMPIAGREEQPELNDLDAAMAWLESLAARQGADQETLSTPQDQRSETPPEWVSREIEQPESKAAPVETTAPVVETATLVEGPAETIEGTAVAAQAAAIEPEITAPAEEKTGAANPETPEPLSIQPPASNMVTRFAEMDSETTQSIPQDAFENNSLYPFKEFSSIKSVEAPAETELTSSENLEQPVEDQFTRAEKKTSPLGQSGQPSPQSEMDADAAFAWLEALAAQQGADEGTLTTPPEDRSAAAPDWVLEQPAEPAGLTDASDLLQGAMTLEEPAEPEKISAEPNLEQDWANSVLSPLASQVEETTEITPPPEPVEWIQETPEPQLNTEAPVVEQPIPSEAQPTQEPVEPLPAWLQGLDQASVEPLEDIKPSAVEDLPDWLKGFETPAEAPLTQASDESISISSWLKDQEVPAVDHLEAAQPAVDDTQPVKFHPAEQVEEAAPLPDSTFQPPEKVEAEQVPSKGTQAGEDPVLFLAQAAMQDGKIDQALAFYNRLIEQGQHLDEIVHDLRDSLYRYPVEISIWQTLGDAYIRNNHIQEALDAYTKAEELLK
ncbi:MAG TPA: tetratricopeptide repeat protein [Anaerolineaceae bacterium]|nr:tetratricopeptide repeat protein [Anaerolineaceae bacterium]